jgi:hypothetical protein
MKREMDSAQGRIRVAGLEFIPSELLVLNNRVWYCFCLVSTISTFSSPTAQRTWFPCYEGSFPRR